MLRERSSQSEGWKTRGINKTKEEKSELISYSDQLIFPRQKGGVLDQSWTVRIMWGVRYVHTTSHVVCRGMWTVSNRSRSIVCKHHCSVLHYPSCPGFHELKPNGECPFDHIFSFFSDKFAQGDDWHTFIFFNLLSNLFLATYKLCWTFLRQNSRYIWKLQ